MRYRDWLNIDRRCPGIRRKLARRRLVGRIVVRRISLTRLAWYEAEGELYLEAREHLVVELQSQLV